MHPRIVSYFLLLLCMIHLSSCQSPKKDCDHGICWYDESYPHEKIRQKFYATDDYLEAYGKIKKPAAEVLEAKTPDNLCNVTYSMNVRPLSVDGKRLYFLHTEKYHHMITLTVCNPNQDTSQCESSDDTRPLDYVFGCEQKYTRVKVLTYSIDEDDFKELSITYPSACRCESMIIV